MFSFFFFPRFWASEGNKSKKQSKSWKKIGAISGLLAKFNKRIKDKINYEKLLARDRRQVFLDKKFNPDLIKRITILKDSSIVNDFMKYCDFTDQFIEFSSDYYLVDQIINCFEEYNNLTMVNK